MAFRAQNFWILGALGDTAPKIGEDKSGTCLYYYFLLIALYHIMMNKDVYNAKFHDNRLHHRRESVPGNTCFTNLISNHTTAWQIKIKQATNATHAQKRLRQCKRVFRLSRTLEVLTTRTVTVEWADRTWSTWVVVVWPSQTSRLLVSATWRFEPSIRPIVVYLRTHVPRRNCNFAWQPSLASCWQANRVRTMFARVQNCQHQMAAPPGIDLRPAVGRHS